MFEHDNKKYVTMLKPGHPPCRCGQENCKKMQARTRGHEPRSVILSDYVAVPWISTVGHYKVENIARFNPLRRTIPGQRAATHDHGEARVKA